MSKKNFDIKKTADRFISSSEDQLKKNDTLNTHNTHSKQYTPSTQQKQGTQSVHQVQKPTSKRGQKLPRINIAFTHQNLDYLQRISKLEDTSITQYVNDLIDADRTNRIKDLEQAEEALEKAKQILKGI